MPAGVWNEAQFNLIELLVKIRDLGLLSNSLVNVKLDYDKNSTDQPKILTVSIKWPFNRHRLYY